ncbi:DegV family protein [Bacillus taeanensis]|uniref:DegV family protein n=1 Tax=Bacillus taeanensis TaxID=273032 RepID=A0A366XVB9_9BACI|nr:DegV family protein [Bacillus taeanensis]RBW69518.1 DegV family protein [Bacillus taeanensis]
MQVKIITDSSCDLPVEFLEKYEIDMVPLVVNLENEEYFDKETIQSNDVYDAMRNEKVPKTAQAPAYRLQETFTSYAEKQHPIIFIAMSSKLSGTYQTAVLMKEEVLEKFPNASIAVIDSYAGSGGHGLLVKYAAELAHANNNLEDMERKLNHVRNHIEHIFTVDNVEYLYRGGRLSKASAVIGGLLNIKPILTLPQGKIHPVGKVRGQKKLYTKILELMTERGENLEEQTIIIVHADNSEGADHLKKLIEEKTNCHSFIIHTIGSAVGAHVGPGALGVFFFNQLSIE